LCLNFPHGLMWQMASPNATLILSSRWLNDHRKYSGTCRRYGSCTLFQIPWFSWGVCLCIVVLDISEAALPDTACSDTPGLPTEKPVVGLFPGVDVAASNAAWPCTGKQPTWSQEWQFTTEGQPSTCNAPTGEEAAVIYSTMGEWPATCESDARTGQTNIADDDKGLGLRMDDEVKDIDACRSACMTDAYCAVWQFRGGKCYRGAGIHCWNGNISAGAASQVCGGERIMHGMARELLNLKDAVIKIKESFLVNLGSFNVGSFRVVDRCRAWCHSNLKCQYWQVDLDEAGKERCWVENNLGVPYPLTVAAITREALVAGAYIQHFCPPPQDLVACAPFKSLCVFKVEEPIKVEKPIKAEKPIKVEKPQSHALLWCILGGLVVLAVLIGIFWLWRRGAREVKPKEDKSWSVSDFASAPVPDHPAKTPSYQPLKQMPSILCVACRQELLDLGTTIPKHCSICGNVGSEYRCPGECQYVMCLSCHSNGGKSGGPPMPQGPAVEEIPESMSSKCQCPTSLSSKVFCR